MKTADFLGVVQAREKLRVIVPDTPIHHIEINRVKVACKCESAQPVGAFKLRGAWHRLTELSSDERAREIVAFSSGNHAQGVAWAAQRLGIGATIVMPSDAPPLKVEGTRKLGAEVIFYDRARDSREAIAGDLAAARCAVLVPSFDDPWIIEGQGSCGVEAVEQLGFVPDRIIVPCGGGGLAAGIALGVPGAEIVTVEPENWDDMARSLAGGSIVPVEPDAPFTLCDALMTQRVAPRTFDILHARGVRGVWVTEREIIDAMRLAYRALGLVIEPGGAVALAAALAGRVTMTERSLVILSGGNVDSLLFDRLIGG